MRQAKLAGLALSMLGILAGLLGAGTASATYLEVEGEAKHESVTFKATLAPATSMVVRNTIGDYLVTCAQSEMHAKTEPPFIGETVTGAVSTMTFTGNCDMAVHKMGLLHFEHLKDSTNAIVRSSGAEVTVFVYGMYLTCKTGSESAEFGRLTGVKEGHATFHLNAVVNCGFAIPSMIWQGTYQVTSPTGLGALSEDTTLEVSGSAKDESLSLEASLKSGSSSVIKSMAGELINTCTGSVMKASTIEPYTAAEVHGNLDAVGWSGCSSVQGALRRGSLSIIHVPGTTNGTVISSELWIAVKGSVCKTNRTPIGTLTGVKEGHATMDVDAVLNCGASPSVKWEGTYTVTSPTGLGVTG